MRPRRRNSRCGAMERSAQQHQCAQSCVGRAPRCQLAQYSAKHSLPPEPLLPTALRSSTASHAARRLPSSGAVYVGDGSNCPRLNDRTHAERVNAQMLRLALAARRASAVGAAAAPELLVRQDLSVHDRPAPRAQRRSAVPTPLHLPPQAPPKLSCLIRAAKDHIAGPPLLVSPPMQRPIRYSTASFERSAS